MRHYLLAALVTVLCAGTASAVPMGTGLLHVEVGLTGYPTDNLSCSRTYGYADVDYDVFGVFVNLSTDLVETTCDGSNVGGVAQPGHCASFPSSSIWAFDVFSDAICTDPPTCNSHSFVTGRALNVTGTLPATIGADVVYTGDGELTSNGIFPSTTLANCAIVGQVVQLTGTVGLNAFQAEATPVGPDQTVSFPDTTFFNPLTLETVPIDVDVTFSQVTGAGTTTVTASSNAAGEIPSNFAIAVDGFNAAFLDITTTAAIAPPIEICSTYDDDSPDDGFVDDTTPAIPEVALSFLHGEGDPKEFFDRTSSRDPVNNVICATVDTLSPFVVAVRTDGICTAENNPCNDGDACTTDDFCNASLVCVGGGATTCDDDNVCTANVCVSPLGCTYPPAPAVACNVSNDKAILLVRDNADDVRDQVLFKWLKGNSSLAEFGDPTVATDYTLCAFDDNKMLVSATVPAGAICDGDPCWSFTGPPTMPKGVKFVDPLRANDGVKLVKGKADTAGKANLLFKALGANVPPISLAGIVYPVTVQVRAEGVACWEQEFSAGDEKKNDGTLFKAVHVVP